MSATDSATDQTILELLIDYQDRDRDRDDQKELADIVQRMHKHFAPAAHPTGPSALEIDERALADAAAKLDEHMPEEALSAVRDHFGPEAMLPELTAADKSEPPAVIWYADPGARDTDPRTNSLLSQGETAILAGPGGVGKSYVSLAVAIAAATATDSYGEACGLRVREGPVVIVNYEDTAGRIAARIERMTKQFPARLRIWRQPEPLFVHAGEDDEGPSAVAHPGASWERLWAAVEAVRPSLVIIDPISAALEGVSANESTPVRAFIRALTAQATAAKTGIWLVGHDTKSARSAARKGEDPGAGVVAGSGTWFDAARGLLYLAHVPSKDTSDPKPKRTLECVKANYGRDGWSVPLREIPGSVFTGFERDPTPKNPQGKAHHKPKHAGKT